MLLHLRGPRRVIVGAIGSCFGTTPVASITFAGLSLAADVLAIILPAAAVALWHARRHVLAFAGWTTWALAATLAILASLGYAELHISDTAAGRAAIVTTSTALTNQREFLVATARLAVTTATKAREAECGIRGPRCRDREIDERMALAALTSAIATPIPTVPTISASDPQVTAVLRPATWLGVTVTAADVVNVRLALTATIPNIAGLVLAFGIALRRSARA